LFYCKHKYQKHRWEENVRNQSRNTGEGERCRKRRTWSAIDPDFLTFGVVTDLVWFEPQVDLSVGTFRRITAVNDVSEAKAI